MEKITTNGNGELKEGMVVCQTNLGLELRGTLVKLTRFMVVFEIYNSTNVLRTSEVLSDFRIIVNEHTIYSGRATVQHLMNMGQVLVCEATLNESSWMDVEFNPTMARTGDLRAKFSGFLQEWQKLYKILPEYKVIIADMQSFFMDLRLWLDQVELAIRSSPSDDRLQLEQVVIGQLANSIVPNVNVLFEKFEAIAERVEEELKPAHQNYARRQLHPLLLCSPFLYRVFSKPLGFAGDYEMVNMIMRNQFEGSSLYAKMVNLWFLQQPPAEAHRNRIQYLTQNIVKTTLRVAASGRIARILSLGCGPAHEVQKFLQQSHLADQACFALLDFNAETLAHAGAAIEKIKVEHQRITPVSFVKKSVNEILKQAGKSFERSLDDQYDLIYCAGLFDYLTDPVCRRLSSVLYEWLAPNGLLITTNVDSSNPRQLTMDYIMEWHLIYRNGKELNSFKSDKIVSDDYAVKSDPTGVNIYLEVRKPNCE